MIHRERMERPQYVYPPDEWRMVEKRFYPRFVPATETIFTTANGYLGMRGCFEEGAPVYHRGTFVNGFFESWPIVYGEKAFGFASTGQTIVNVPDTRTIRLYLDDEPFSLATAHLLEFERALDMRSGTLDRHLIWETPAGKRVTIRSRRIVSLRHRHLAAISYEVVVEGGEGPLVLSSETTSAHRMEVSSQGDPRQARQFQHEVLESQVDYTSDRRLMLGYRTISSGMTLACGTDHVIRTECPYTYETSSSQSNGGKTVFLLQAKPGKPIQLVKLMAYHTSRSAPPQELCERAERTLDRAVEAGFDSLVKDQREVLDDFWHRADVAVEGDPYVQQAIRFNLFQICQATAKAEGVGLPAKGLTGQGYEGHYFWDSEIYVLPFLIYTSPRIARNLLMFRHSYLQKARERAREVNQKGALFPWRTINGEEASAYYAAGTAQYHINADIVYALRKYVQVTGDLDFLYGPGAEILVETARLWADLGFFSEQKGGKFCINGVTGPDEYNTVVNNNTFTNLMARENLWYAAETLETLRRERADRFLALAHETELRVEEIDEWKRAADSMYLPYDEQRGIHPQDDDFLERRPWNFDATPPEHYPLLLHYHPLVIYRHQVIKQADVVLAMFLLGDEFSPEQKKRNFDYYDPMTTGDSSLSACIQSIIAFELGYVEKAGEYLRYAALMDLGDVAGNVKDGCHVASMGGTWMAVVYGFAGMRDYDGKLSFRPRLPVRDLSVRFPLLIRGRELEVAINRREVTYLLREGTDLTIEHEGEEIHLTTGKRVTRDVAPPQ